MAELLSFFRLSLADVAESLESGARQTKEKLRGVEDDVQAGQRDALGREKVDAEGKNDEGAGTNETKAKFEERMDTAKGIGLTAIDVGQQTKQTAQEYTEISREKVLNAFDNVGLSRLFCFVWYLWINKGRSKSSRGTRIWRRNIYYFWCPWQMDQ